jgi:hypothetical protein
MRVVRTDARIGIEIPDDLRVISPLLAAAEDGDLAPAAWRPLADADPARGRGSGGGDLGCVHDRRRQTRLRVVHDDQARDVRQAAGLVLRVAGDPLERRHIVVPQICGHRVDEGIPARVNARLRGELDPTGCDGAIRGLDEVELLGKRGEESGDVLAPQVEQAHI